MVKRRGSRSCLSNDVDTQFGKGRNNKIMKYVKNEKKNVKKVVSDAKSEAYGDLYNKLGSRE